LDRIETANHHPSYGILRFGRVQGTPESLFGTHLHPQNFIQMELNRGEHIRDNGADYYFPKESLVRCWMSNSQFAEMITSMNAGSGVPVTIRQFNGDDLPYPPEQEVGTKTIHNYFKERMKGFSKDIKENRKDIEDILNKSGTINKGDKKKLKGIFDKMLMEVESNIPFFLEQYEESSQKIVENAKTEIDSFVTHMAMKIGIEKLKSGFSDVLKLEESK